MNIYISFLINLVLLIGALIFLLKSKEKPANLFIAVLLLLISIHITYLTI